MDEATPQLSVILLDKMELNWTDGIDRIWFVKRGELKGDEPLVRGFVQKVVRFIPVAELGSQ